MDEQCPAMAGDDTVFKSLAMAGIAFNKNRIDYFLNTITSVQNEEQTFPILLIANCK